MKMNLGGYQEIKAPRGLAAEVGTLGLEALSPQMTLRPASAHSWPSLPPCRSPALIGCFIVDRQYFEEIGLLDEGMEVYGGENVELGIRVSEISHTGLSSAPMMVSE
jgi:hypothetical protein